MTQYCYLASYDSISSPTPSNVWFASWSLGNDVSWSQTQPGTPDGVNTFAVAVVCETTARTNVTSLGSPKTMPPPPHAFAATDLSDFQDQFKSWTIGDKALAMPADAPVVERG